MSKKPLLIWALFYFLFIEVHSQIPVEIVESVGNNFFSEDSLISISATSADERAPFIISSRDFLYSIIEFKDTTEFTRLRIFVSTNGGKKWNYRKTLAVSQGSLSNPQAFVYKSGFYATFQMEAGSKHAIYVYENDDPELKETGVIKEIIESEDRLEHPSLLVIPDRDAIPIIHIAYFDFTRLTFSISSGEINGEFFEAFTHSFGYPDGFLRIDRVAGSGRNMFVFNAKVDSLNQIVVLGFTPADGWHVKFLTQSVEPKYNPTISALGKNWMVVYQTPTAVKYFGRFEGYGLVKNHVLVYGASFPTVRMTDSPNGKIVCAYVKNKRIFRKESSVENPFEWSDEKPFYDRNFPPSKDDFISLAANFLNGGVAFSTLNPHGDHDVYFAKVAPGFKALKGPSHLSASLAEPLGVKLTWDDNSDSEEGYKIFRKEKIMGIWEIIDSVEANVTNYTDTNALGGRTYDYFVRAFADSGLSKISNAAEITLPHTDVPNVFYYRLHVLLKNTVLGDIRVPIKEGSLLEHQKYFLPTFNFSSVYQGVGTPYKAISKSYFSIGDIGDEDLFFDMFLVYDYNSNEPPQAFNEKLFFYFIVKVFKLPNFAPVDESYVFREGEFFTFHIEKEDSFLTHVRKLRLNPDSLKVFYITDKGFDSTGVFTINRKDFLEFRATHFSKFGGGRRGITSVTEVEKTDELPEKFGLNQNYPNPFNPTTTISYSIPNCRGEQSVNVTLNIYNTLGQKIATLVEKEQKPGKYSVKFNAGALPSGIYFYRLRAGSFIATKKMILLK
jgi:hypothetical protein